MGQLYMNYYKEIKSQYKCKCCFPIPFEIRLTKFLTKIYCAKCMFTISMRFNEEKTIYNKKQQSDNYIEEKKEK